MYLTIKPDTAIFLYKNGVLIAGFSPTKEDIIKIEKDSLLKQVDFIYKKEGFYLRIFSDKIEIAEENSIRVIDYESNI